MQYWRYFFQKCFKMFCSVESVYQSGKFDLKGEGEGVSENVKSTKNVLHEYTATRYLYKPKISICRFGCTI